MGVVGGVDCRSTTRTSVTGRRPQAQGVRDDAADVPVTGVVLLSDEGVEDAIYDSMRCASSWAGLRHSRSPDATTLLHFRHLMEEHGLGEKLFAAQTALFDEQGWIMRGGVDRGRHDHRRAVVDEERHWATRP